MIDWLWYKNKGLIFVLCVFVLTACAVCILRLSVGVGEVEIRGARSTAAGFIPGCVSRPPLFLSAPEPAVFSVAGVQPTTLRPPTHPTTHTLLLKINNNAAKKREVERTHCQHFRQTLVIIMQKFLDRFLFECVQPEAPFFKTDCGFAAGEANLNQIAPQQNQETKI